MVFLLKLTVCWGFFALLYALLLHRETFFRANRLYLLGTLLAGILLAAFGDRLLVSAEETGLQMITLPVVSAGFRQATEEVSRQLLFMDFAWFIYIPGVVFMLMRTGWGITRLIGMARSGVSESLPGKVRLIRSAEVSTPFSFFKWIFVPAEAREHTPEMIAHERAHANGWHSVDIMLIECLCALCWFHPLVYWYRRSLRTVHEYLADAEASRLTDKKQYGLLLIRQSQSGMPVAFANHFFQSPLKQRLIMLMKKHSNPARALRYALVLPLTVLFVLLFQKAPVLAREVNNAYAGVSPDPISVGMLVEQPQPFLFSTDCQKAPEFPGGMEALGAFITAHLKYPKSADGKWHEGTVAVSFTVKPDGNIQDVHVNTLQEASTRMPAAYEAEALRVISMLPQWTPGQKDCKPAAFELCIPIKFKAGTKKTVSSTQQGPQELFDVDSPPLFPGGDAAMMKYLVDHIKVSESDKHISGVIAFRFIVATEGSVTNVEVVKDAGVSKATLDQIVQVLQNMPKWKPAQKDGEPVGVYFTLPVRITMQ